MWIKNKQMATRARITINKKTKIKTLQWNKEKERRTAGNRNKERT